MFISLSIIKGVLSNVFFSHLW